MVATLAVHEEMGKKIDREAVALHLLPQLWQMSVGPRKLTFRLLVIEPKLIRYVCPFKVLNVEQFARFMHVIRALGERVEREHSQHLRDAQRIEDRSGMSTSAGGTPTPFASHAPADFETLVGGGAARATAAGAGAGAAAPASQSSLEDDIWGSILNSSVSIIFDSGDRALREL